jgi:formate hydrogenlyase subunit 6/NADH:ubiquinone oxidoreductase subunit I
MSEGSARTPRFAHVAMRDVMACIGCNDCMLACPLPQASMVTIAEINAASSNR